MCGVCKEDKDRAEFPPNRAKKDGLSHSCKRCKDAYSKKHYAANQHKYVAAANRCNQRSLKHLKEIVDKAKSKPCADCGMCYDAEVMDFDHVSGIKLGCVAMLIRNHNEEALRAEIAKCEVVCSNCHRARTKRRRLEII